MQHMHSRLLIINSIHYLIIKVTTVMNTCVCIVTLVNNWVCHGQV